MIFSNAVIFAYGQRFINGAFRTGNGKFTEILEGYKGKGDVDLKGRTVIPGLVDIHIHGCAGSDFSDGNEDGLRNMSEWLLGKGITSFLPTSMTLPPAELETAFSTAASLKKKQNSTGARITGIHMEGPFFSYGKRGAQNPEYLMKPDAAVVKALYEKSGGLLKIVDVAPEVEGALSFTEEISKYCCVSAAHTESDYETAKQFFSAGGSHVTHLYNAMPAFHHRRPGVIGAAAENPDVTAELIGDGLHVHPSAVRLAFSMFPERICLISDCLRCAGMPEGTYMLGGQQFFFRNGEARLADGTLAGPSIDLYQGMRNVISFGVPAETVIRAATLRPAMKIGMEEEIGCIKPGCHADFVVCGPSFARQEVYLSGELKGRENE